MQLIKAEIVGFGAYRQQEFVFSPTNQLIYGENEAGKSTLYQFIQAMLFGFPKKSGKKRDYTPTDGTAFGGRLWLKTSQYQSIKIERFRQTNKGKARVWLDETETTEEHLHQLLNGLSLAMFQDIYTFQQEQLSAIDHLEEQELHQALLSIGISGSQTIMAQIQEDKKNNQALFRPRGQRLPLNQFINQYKQLQTRIQQKEQQEAQVQAKTQRIIAIDQELTQLKQQLRDLTERVKQAEQQTLHWSLYEEWQALNHTLPKELAAPELTKRIQQFYQRYHEVTATIQKHQAEIARLEQGNTSDRYFFYLEQEALIQQISKGQVELARMEDQLIQETARLVDDEQRKQALEQKWGWQANQPPEFAQQEVYEQLTTVSQLQQEIQLLSEQTRWLAERQAEKSPSRTSNPHQSTWGLISLVALVVGILLAIGKLVGPSLFAFFISILSAYRLIQQPRLKKQGETADEQAKVQQQLATKKEVYEQLIQQMRPFFGNQAPVEEWPVIVRHYDEEVEMYHSLLASLPSLRQRVHDTKKRLAERAKSWAVFADWLPLANLSVMEQVAKILAFGEEMQAMKMDRLQQPSTLLARQVQQLQEEREHIIATHQSLLQQLGIEQPADIPMWMRQWEALQIQKQRQEELATMLAPIYPHPITKEALDGFVQKNRQQQERLESQREIAVTEQQKRKLELAQLQEDGTLDELYQQRVLLEDDLRESTTAWASNQIHAAMLSDLATNRSEQQLPQLLQKATHFFQILTNHSYQKIWFQEGQLMVTNEQESFDSHQLSTGTKDQLIMAIRFAYVALQGSEPLCPVIIDDGWLHYDHQRKYNLARLFKEFGQTTQVICLSSDREMVSYYQELEQQLLSIE